MSISHSSFKRLAWASLFIFVILTTGALWINFKARAAQDEPHLTEHLTAAQNRVISSNGLHPVESGAFIISMHDGRSVCEATTRTEAVRLQRRSATLSRITSLSEMKQETSSGLKIILRGTPQLESFPAAKEAFLRAAATWESLIETQISLVIDVDFGTTQFGEPFPSDKVIGSTSTQFVGHNTIYPAVRNALTARTRPPANTAIPSLLPPNILPTDIGDQTGIIGAASLFRVLGFLPAVADPDAEREQIGDPPAISFNSKINFDFDQRDGIAPGKLDFEGAALHEIGHVLGFVSTVGFKEIDPEITIQPSVWDLFRFRPGVDFSNFSSAQRILSSGGIQTFFAGNPSLELSTGKPDGNGGDGSQASHWKDNALTGKYIGIMDPSASPGQRDRITDNDLLALATFGYRIRTTDHPPTSELATDDGTIEGGARGDGTIFINRLTPSAYPARLETIRIHFGRFQNLPDPSGAIIRLIVFASASGASTPPVNPTLLVDQMVALPAISGNGEFIDFSIPNGPTINAGDFFVGFQLPNPSSGVVCSLDSNGAQQQRSFFSLDNGVTYQGPLQMGNPPTLRNAMIRALVSINRGVRIGSASAKIGSTLTVPLEMLAKGDENSVNFSVIFDPSILSFVNLDNGESGLSLSKDESQITEGRLGISASAGPGQSFVTGSRRLGRVTFSVKSGVTAGSTVLSFGDQPIGRRVTGTNATDLTNATIFTGGTISLVGEMVITSAASFATTEFAPEAIAAAFGNSLAIGIKVAETTPLPHGLLGTTVRVTDSSGKERLAPLFSVSPNQVNFQIPPGTAIGPASVTIISGDKRGSVSTIQIVNLAAGLFSANSDGRDVAAGNILRIRGTQEIFEDIAKFDSTQNRFVPEQIDIGPEGDSLFLILYGTGLRFRNTGSVATATIGGTIISVPFIGPVPDFIGLDQINIGPLPRSLAGRGEIEITLTIDGKAANTLKVAFK